MKATCYLSIPLARYAILCLAFSALTINSVAAIQPRSVRQDIVEVLRSARASAAHVGAAGQKSAAVRLTTSSDGYVRFLGAPPAHHFPHRVQAAMNLNNVALDYVKKNSRIFGVNSPAVNFVHRKNRMRNQRTHVRFDQTYAGLMVFGAQVNVQLDAQGQVESVLSDIERDTQILDDGVLSTLPTLTAEEAGTLVQALFQPQAPTAHLTTTEPQLIIYSPSVLSEEGPIRLVWDLDVASEDGWEVNEQVLLDAHTGEIACQIAKNHHFLQRAIYDADSTTNSPGTLVRSEGEPVSGIPEVDNAYLYLGQTYNFYQEHHGRQGINDGPFGIPVIATVRYCSHDPENPDTPICPMNGTASWSPSNYRMHFGTGRVFDDIAAHEYTHGVTQFESGLIYRRISGAINESFSDIWGEFVDLSNGRGDDTPENRWLVAEGVGGGGFRDMADPPRKGDPDRLSSPYYYYGPNDKGGVHRNSGVNNKLCYLLTDGDTFNGRTISGMGMARVADLYYEVQVSLLTRAADWRDLADALRQAAINLGWSQSDRDNVWRACQAVEITDGDDIYVAAASFCSAPNGDQGCFNDFGGPYPTVMWGTTSALPGDRIFIRGGSYNETIVLTKKLLLRSYTGSDDPTSAIIGR